LILLVELSGIEPAPTYLNTGIVLVPDRVPVENTFPQDAVDAHAIFLVGLAGLDSP